MKSQITAKLISNAKGIKPLNVIKLKQAYTRIMNNVCPWRLGRNSGGRSMVVEAQWR